MIPNLYPACDDCARPVDDETVGPSCGSHDLHADCLTPCRDCRDARRETENE